MTPEAFASALMDRCDDVQRSANHEPSFWLRVRLADLEAREATGRLVGCGHSGLQVSTLWADGWWCFTCAVQVQVLAAAGEDAYRCDRCGVVSSLLTLGAVTLPGRVVVFGLCATCRSKEIAR